MSLNPISSHRLQANSDLIRNICILAHVDHGKTTLSDSLLASNGIISQSMAGKLRYLDSRPDEQQRGITMESSAISLHFKVATRPTTDESETSKPASPKINEYLINLIDSPGHIDFSSEVSAASRLCDGALVLVDAVEGVLSQTVIVLRQAWVEKLKPVLVINKIDRLITELQLTPSEAYKHLTRLIEQVNAVMGSFYAGDRMEQDLKWREQHDNQEENQDNYEETSDENLYFSPDKNNVVFASAIDGWGFNISQFASIYEKKLGIKREKLEKVLWGDFYFDPKTKRVVDAKHFKGNVGSRKPLFVQLVLDNIWKVYESAIIEPDTEQRAKIVTALNLKVVPQIVKGKDGKQFVSAVFGQWIPLSRSLLLTVIEIIPPPSKAQAIRIPSILDSIPDGNDPTVVEPKVLKGMLECDKNGPLVSYVSKVIAVPEKELIRKKKEQKELDEASGSPMSAIELRKRKARELAASLQSQPQSGFNSERKDEEDDYDEDDLDAYFEKLKLEQEKKDEEQEKLIGFTRVLSGTLSVGQELYLLHPKYDYKKDPTAHRVKVTVTDLFLLMGRDLIPMTDVPAGNIVGIGGLDGKILKNGTLVSLEHGHGPNLASMSNVRTNKPIVRVAVEPVDPTKLDALEAGLKLLNLSDPMVQVSVADNGEHILMAAGELHLERCIKDLKERFAKVDIQVSQPIVPYKETIVVPDAEQVQQAYKQLQQQKQQDEEQGNNKVVPVEDIIGLQEAKIGSTTVKLRILPLLPKVVQFLHDNHHTIESLISLQRQRKDFEKSDENGSKVTELEDKSWCIFESQFDEMIGEVLSKEMKKSNNLINTKRYELFSNYLKLKNVISFGPKRTGANILIDATPGNILKTRVVQKLVDEGSSSTSRKEASFGYEESLITGFQLATQQGPLTAEPVEGVAVLVEYAESANSTSERPDAENEDSEDQQQKKSEVTNSGRMIPVTKEMIHHGFLAWSPRLLFAMYSCEIQATMDVLGKVYGVITRRRGRVINEEMREGTPFYLIHAKLPVVESFGFSEEIRKKTSGAANPQLVFDGFQMVIDQDPFWVPTTEEELEDLGETADRENLAKMYMDSVRRRKGLAVDEKVVNNAEKQRTLKR